ncbi:uncharacterized protein LOC110632737 isoform X2 [Hevea brasiliensis]|uniref:uncharacterized protein LOC110632737 isoform X2 n=1 Tax=Hevea brasiliensis TaxID=3981 RepID=UPI0025F86734|nr:uncharacterized protein LOC110632737 isoform X2 [Hevea brasiliensis]
MPSVANLVKLRVLDLSWCHKIQELPHGMEQLSNLRCLNLACANIEVFPVGLLAKFILLEDLLMVGCGHTWGSRAVEGITGGANIEEIISSTSLSSLRVDFWNLEIFDYYVKSGHWEQLDEFKFNIGQPFEQCSEKRSIAFKGNLLLNGRPIVLPTNTTGLSFNECPDIFLLSAYLFDLKELRSYQVYSCRNMKYIIYANQTILSTLEILKLNNLFDLRTISVGIVEQYTLMNLKIIEVVACGSVIWLFRGDILNSLQNLEEIVVGDCAKMRYIMYDSYAGKIPLPKLQSLKLYDLPELESIYDGVITSHFLRSVDILGCNALKRLPMALFDDSNLPQQLPPPSLKEIKGTFKLVGITGMGST